MTAKKTTSKKVISKPATGITMIVPPGTIVKEATKMDNILGLEQKLLSELTTVRQMKADHKAWLKAEGEKS